MKLPGIKYSGVSVPLGRGPGAAVVKANQIGQMTDTLVKGLSYINEQKREYDLESATVNAGSDVTGWEAENAGRQTFSREEIEAAGLDSEVNMVAGQDAEGNDIMRTEIPRHEVYPLLLNKHIDDSVSKYGSTLSNQQDAKNWRRDMDAKRVEIVGKEVANSQRKAVEWRLKQGEVDIARAQADGNFVGAERLIQSHYVNPAMRTEAMHNNRVSAEKWEIGRQLMETDPDKLDETIDYLSSDKFLEETLLSPAEQNRYYGAALGRRNAMTTAQNKAEAQAQDAASVEALTLLTKGQWTAADIMQNRHAFGRTNYQYLLKQAEAESTGSTKFATPSSVSTNFEVSVMELETGFYATDGERTFDEEIDSMEKWVIDNAVITDPVTGENALNISGADVTKWRERLSKLRASPYEPNTPFSVAAEELSIRIRGGKAVDIMGRAAGVDPESANLYAEAMGSLRTFVQENGGPKADVTQWRKDNMPYYLTQASRLSFTKLDRKTREGVVFRGDGNNNKVDIAETSANFKADMAASKTDAERAEVRRRISLFDQWVTGPGANYAE